MGEGWRERREGGREGGREGEGEEEREGEKGGDSHVGHVAYISADSCTMYDGVYSNTCQNRTAAELK